jgi:hypothetical protein
MNGVIGTEERHVWVPGNVSNGIACLIGSYFLSCIQKKAIVLVMPKIIFLLHVNNCYICHHLLLVMNGGVKGTEEGQVWVPANVSNGKACLY